LPENVMAVAESASRVAYFKWLARHPSEAAALRDVPPEVLSRIWLDAWQQGGWDAIRSNTDLGLMLARVVERLDENIHLYRTAEVEREAELGSPLWPTPESDDQEALPF